jgi:hypothetical protein
MTAQLAAVDDHILAGVDQAVSVHNPNIIPRSASDKPQVSGMQFDFGYLSPYFVTDFERMEVAFESVYILIHEKKLSSKKDLLPLLDQITNRGKPLACAFFTDPDQRNAVWNSIRLSTHRIASFSAHSDCDEIT